MRRTASARLALVLAIVVLSSPAVPASARVSTPAPRAQADVTSATLRLGFQPISVTPDGAFAVVVTADRAPVGSYLYVDIYGRAVDPAAPEAPVAKGSQATFDRVFLDHDTAGGRQASGFTIDLYHRGTPRPPTSWAWRIDEPGVYPVRVQLRDRDGNILTTLVTYLVRLPGAGQDAPRAEVALLATVHRGPPADAAVDGFAASPDWGRETDVLAALRDHPSLPASFAVTPDTVARLTADRRRTSTVLLDRLRTEVGRPGRELLDAPYVDLDPTALVRTGLADELSRQRDLGRAALAANLPTPPVAGTWPLHRPVTGEALASLRARGVFRVVVPADAFSGRPPRAPLSVAAGGDQVRALAVESAFGLPSGPTADPVLAAHRFLARLAIVAATATTAPAVVVNLDADSVPPETLSLVLDGLTLGTPYYRTATVSDVFARVPERPGPDLAPPTTSSQGDYPAQARQVRAALDSYASMLIDRPELVSRFDRPLALSASVDLALSDRQRDLALVDAALQARFDAISTIERDKVTLGARVAHFPYSIRSRLSYPVRVRVDLQANDRLAVPTDPLVVTIAGPRSVAQVRVRARASGDAPLRLTVRSPDGRVVLAESRYTVRSTAVSGVGVLLTVGAAGFLALWWGRHWWRERRRRRFRHARTL
ncbi:MAG: DUF6049 family protein [Acidimicrobiales bacterium]